MSHKLFFRSIEKQYSQYIVWGRKSYQEVKHELQSRFSIESLDAHNLPHGYVRIAVSDLLDDPSQLACFRLIKTATTQDFYISMGEYIFDEFSDPNIYVAIAKTTGFVFSNCNKLKYLIDIMFGVNADETHESIKYLVYLHNLSLFIDKYGTDLLSPNTLR